MHKSPLLLILLCITLSFSMEGFSFRGELFGYSDNLEYFNKYREGVLLVGGDANLFFNYAPLSTVDFSLGVHLSKKFGDEKFYTKATPYFRAHYNRDAYTVNIGVLDFLDRHRLPDAILYEQVSFVNSIEEGVQFKFDFDEAFFADIWLSIDELNTPEHREHLDFGLYLENTFRKLQTSGMVYWDHYGGQLYAPENDRLRNNVTGSINCKFTQPLKSGKGNIGTDLRFLGSATTDLSNGYGFLVAPWWYLNSFRTTFSIYKGFDYHSWEGNQIYNTNDIYYYLQVDRTVTLKENLLFEWGVRFDFVDILPKDYFDRFENQLWVSLRTDFDIPLFQ